MLVFIMLICVAAAVLTGVAPAFHSMRPGMVEQLKQSSRGSTSGPGAGRTRSLLVISEVALERWRWWVRASSHEVSTMPARSIPEWTRTTWCAREYYVETFCRTGAERRQFCRRLSERLAAVPGVGAVSYANFVPLEFGEGSDTQIQVEGYVPAAGESMRIVNSTVSPGYFDVLKIPLLERRDFRAQDDSGTAPVLIVNQAFQRRFFGKGPVLGRRVRAGGDWVTVIGLVADSKFRRLTEGVTPCFYTASRQTSGGEFWIAFFVRTTRPLEGMLGVLRREAATVNPATRGSDFVPCQALDSGGALPPESRRRPVAVVGAISSPWRPSVCSACLPLRSNNAHTNSVYGSLWAGGPGMCSPPCCDRA